MIPQADMVPAAFEIRDALQQDASEIARIYNYYIEAGGSTFDKEHWTADRVLTLLDGEPPERWLLGLCDGRVVGWVSARRYSTRHGYRHCCETAIYVMPEACGQGISQELQSRIEQHCRDSGIHHIVARIIADNERSMAFHRRFGFELVGVQKEIGHMDGRWVDVAILQKIFR